MEHPALPAISVRMVSSAHPFLAADVVIYLSVQSVKVIEMVPAHTYVQSEEIILYLRSV